MLSVLLLSLLLLFVFYVYGKKVLEILSNILHFDQNIVAFPLVLIVGEIVVAVVAMTVQLFIPLGSGVFIFTLIALALVIAISNRHWFSAKLPSVHTVVWIIFFLVFVTILENSTHVPTNSDTGLYHAQSIRWFETYKMVPGLGNFEPRYAFNSSWLVLNASLSFVSFGMLSFRLVNGIMFLIASFYFIGGLSDLLKKNLSLSSILKILFLPLGFYFLSSEISSVGNDTPITFFIWIVLPLWIERMEYPEKAGVYDLLIVLISIFAVTVKLSSAPLLLFVAFIVVDRFRRRDWRKINVYILLSLMMLVPWMARSVFISGYLIFPQFQIDIFNLDWKIPSGDVDYLVQGIIGFARYGNSWNPSVSSDFLEWVPKWFDRLTVNRQAMLIGALISPLLLLTAMYTHVVKLSWEYMFACGVMFVGAAFWFFTAPGIRFGYGPLTALCALAAAPFVLKIFTSSAKLLRLAQIAVPVLLFCFQFYVLWFSFESPTIKQRLLLPADYPPSVTSVCDLDGVAIPCRPYGVLLTQCFYDVFPCATVHRLSVEMRGDTFQDGFRSSVKSDQ